MNAVNIFEGDCLEKIKQMDDNTFDLILSDPPYMEYKTGHRKDKGDKLSQAIIYQDQEDQVETIRECLRVLKINSAMFLFTNWQNIWWMQQPFQSFIRNMIIWDKGNWSAGDLKGSFGNQYEVAFLLTKGNDWTYTGKREPDIWHIPRMGTDRIHATEKPVELYRKCIENTCNPDAFILDPYVGSGSSAEAALRTGRNFLGYEIDQEYHKRATERIDRVYKELNIG